MKPIAPQKNNSKILINNKGFALIATISVMVLLVMVALAMLSLSTIEMRSSKISSPQDEARANARLALMIALGELQKNMGPDQRVSVEASMFDTDLNTPDTIEGVKNPRWVGVFSTLADDGTSMISRNVNRGGEWDKRTALDRTGQWIPDWSHGNRHKKVLTYLVSGNEGRSNGSTDPDFQDAMSTELTGDNSVEMVKLDFPKSDTANRVRAKLVPTPAGGYAWWVRDLGTAAKVNIVDSYAGKAPDPNDPSDGGYYRLLAAADAPPKAIDGTLDTSTNELPKLISVPQLGIKGNAAQVAYKNHWFDITTHGFGVLANVRTGKLRRNLSDFLNRLGNGNVSIPALTDGGIVSPGISDLDYLVGSPNEDTFNWVKEYSDFSSWAAAINGRQQTAPRFGSLRKYARLGDNLTANNNTIQQVWPEVENSPNHSGSPYDGYNYKGIKLKNATGHSVLPVLTEATLYFDVSSYPTKNTNGKSVHRLRAHYHPRITLWNPYNVTIEMAPISAWLQIPGSRKLEIKDVAGDTREVTMHLGQSGGVLEGSFFFSLEATKFGPGECLVFSPKMLKKYEYDAISSNLLTASQIPDVGKHFYLDADRGGFKDGKTPINGEEYENYDFPSKPTTWFQKEGVRAEDVRVLLKKYASSRNAFKSSPHLFVASGSPKVGAYSDTLLTWNSNSPADVRTTATSNAELNETPDPRTRESIRLRWIEEPQSNLDNSGMSSADRTRLFSSAYFANWNLRAGFFLKNPFSNMAPKEPFFNGMYSRDIGGPESDWSRHIPPFIKGKARGNPFGYHQDSLPEYVLYDLPRKEIGIVSLAQFQHAKLSEFGWMAGAAVGNSFADPRMKRYRTVPVPENKSHGGWNTTYFGRTPEAGPDYIAWLARGMIQHTCDNDRLVYDISHNVNRSLWDDFFLTSANNARLQQFISDPVNNPLPNSRLSLYSSGSTPTPADLDFHRAARWLVTDGAFNVNSTSVKAWTAILSATRDSYAGAEHPFPGVLNPPAGKYHASSSPFSEEGLAGYRDLSQAELEELAKQIVKQVKLRGPFLSLSDFINRRLVDDETGLMGALQAAIEASGINDSFNANEFEIDTSKEIGDYSVNTSDLKEISDSTNLSHRLKPKSKLAGTPGYLTQANLLQNIGPVISARSDCFLIRAYGEAKDSRGKVIAKAYCEAVVQRVPTPVTAASEYKLNPAEPSAGQPDFGRKFVIKNFRWLSPDEI